MPDPVSATSATTRVAVKPGGDREPAADRHGVARVQEQIEEYLLELVLDPAHRNRRVGELAPQLDLADLELMLEQGEHVADDGVDVHDGRLTARCARPRQRQQPVDDLGGAERLTLDLLEQRRPRIRRVGVLEQHLREARNTGERRVHFVRDARRQQTNRRHLLGNLQLLFEPHVFGDVLQQQNRPDVGAGTGQALQRYRRGIHEDALRFGGVGPAAAAWLVNGTLKSVAPRGFSRRAARSASTNGASNTSARVRPTACPRVTP